MPDKTIVDEMLESALASFKDQKLAKNLSLLINTMHANFVKNLESLPPKLQADDPRVCQLCGKQFETEEANDKHNNDEHCKICGDKDSCSTCARCSHHCLCSEFF